MVGFEEVPTIRFIHYECHVYQFTVYFFYVCVCVCVYLITFLWSWLSIR